MKAPRIQALLLDSFFTMPRAEPLVTPEELQCLLGCASARSATPQPSAIGPDLSDVKGQAGARRALEIAAIGGHALLMLGPPGTGKSMLATRLPGILPPLEPQSALVSAGILSLAGIFNPERFGERPFRAPHHSASPAAVIGGGSQALPGE